MNRKGRRGTQQKRRSAAPPAVAIGIGLVAAIYAQTAWFDYVTFDDDLYASQNPVVRTGLTNSGLRCSFAKRAIFITFRNSPLRELQFTPSVQADSSTESHCTRTALEPSQRFVVRCDDVGYDKATASGSLR
jgi:hypothetical protein